jgi:type VI secretion system protein ImpA
MRWTPEWDRIREARRADDDLETGKWIKKERKVADWKLVRDLSTALLRERTKDLQLSLWLTEAIIVAFPGLRMDCGLPVNSWFAIGTGTLPHDEDGPEDCAGPFDWLNNKLVGILTTIAITLREDQGGLQFQHLLDARRIGPKRVAELPTAKSMSKKKALDQAVADGHVSMDLFAVAVKATKRHSYEEFSADFQQTYDEFKALERVIDEKFGDAAPNLAACRTTLSEIRQAVTDILDEKRREEPPPAATAQSRSWGGEIALPDALPAASPAAAQSAFAGSWQRRNLSSGPVTRTRASRDDSSGRSRDDRT